MKVLVISAHQDDEVIGCGGTICRHNGNGDTVGIVYVASGSKNVPYKEGDKAVELIMSQAYNSCDILDIERDNIYFLDEEDRFLSYNGTLLRKLIKIMREFKPQTIYTHHEHEADVDHAGVYEATKEAFWLSGSPVFLDCGDPIDPIDNFFLFEVWTPLQKPSMFVDITPFIGKKMDALRQYISPLSAVNYDQAVLGLNQYRGIMSGTGDYAEAFDVKKIDFFK